MIKKKPVPSQRGRSARMIKQIKPIILMTKKFLEKVDKNRIPKEEQIGILKLSIELIEKVINEN